MRKSQTIFENEEAVRLLNYFVSYKEIINKTEKNQNEQVDEGLTITVLPPQKETILK